MRYLDTGSRDPADTLYTWLAGVLPDATYVGVQTGYFSYDGIFPFEAEMRDLLDRSGTIRLVVGANEAGVRSVDLSDVLDLLDHAPPRAKSSLTLVAADDVLMHPKTYYVERADGTRHALVGSVNLTHPGLARNIEAALVVDSVNDPGAPFDDFRRAIDKWHSSPHPNAYSVTRSSLAQLVSDGLIDQPVRTRAPQRPALRQRRARVFPALGSILRLPRKKRSVAAAQTSGPRGQGSTQRPAGALTTLPQGSVGIIKRLTRLDTKGFDGGPGTLYIALPNQVMPYLPTRPFGKNNVPRVDVAVEARLDTVPGEVALSGSSPTNITHEGAGTSGSSHGDVRFNYLVGIRREIERIAHDNRVAVPTEGDLVALEILDGPLVRVTFITDQAAITSLTPLLDQHADSWGWLPAGVIAEWDDTDL